MRNVVGLELALLVVLGFSGCGSNTSYLTRSENNTKETLKTGKELIGVLEGIRMMLREKRPFHEWRRLQRR
jgi:hypothetical protein